MTDQPTDPLPGLAEKMAATRTRQDDARQAGDTDAEQAATVLLNVQLEHWAMLKRRAEATHR